MSILDSTPPIATRPSAAPPRGRPPHENALPPTAPHLEWRLGGVRRRDGRAARTLGSLASRGYPVSDDPDFERVVALLDDPQARTILLATSVEPRSATELAERCDASQQTVYRRLDRLVDAGLVEDHTRVRKDGHHDTVYTATLEEVTIGLRDGEFEFTLDRTRPDAVDTLTNLWSKF